MAGGRRRHHRPDAKRGLTARLGAGSLERMGSHVWGAETAAHYDQTSGAMFADDVLGPAIDVLAELAAGGRALEFAIGTGRVGLALRQRGVEVHGIELSPHMVERLRAKPGGADLPVTIGDMTSATADGPFDLVYLVFNTLVNVTTQDEQVAVFANAARHLQPGGRFVVELGVPSLREMPPGQRGLVFDMSAEHVGIDTLDDVVGQLTSSHHWSSIDGRLVHSVGQFRYIWPSELDLMGRCTGFVLRDRWSGWSRQAVDADSPSHVVVFEKAAA